MTTACLQPTAAAAANRANCPSRPGPSVYPSTRIRSLRGLPSSLLSLIDPNEDEEGKENPRELESMSDRLQYTTAVIRLCDNRMATEGQARFARSIIYDIYTKYQHPARLLTRAPSERPKEGGGEDTKSGILYYY
uniref:Uncharacterized protein n=1 Tax=Pristionchus pacificus TaxID=54126 RepID=A0A2A6BUX0_PRIPA|eukprot:PDM69658.1 hypothetical protein PRIPAC_44754 [Pristionchus pacificus]